MKDSPTPPPAPDPNQTASAQTHSNIDTALANARLNRVNQQTPWGSLTYSQGDVDANGIPTYNANIQLSPAQQQLLEQQQQMQTLRNTIAQSLLGQTQSRLSQPLDLSHLHSMMDRGQQYGGAIGSGQSPAGGKTQSQQPGNPIARTNNADLMSALSSMLGGK